MKNLVCFLLLLTGCSESAELIAMKTALEMSGEKVVAKQDQSLTILRDNTTALAAIKSQIDTLEASLVNPEPQREEVIESFDEPQETQQNSRNTSLSVADSPAVRLQFYTQDRCGDCKIQQPKSQEAADDLGVMLEVFDLKQHDDAFTKAGITVTPTTLIVIDDKIRVRFVGVVSSQIIVDRVAEELAKLTTTNQFVSHPIITNSVVSQNDLVAIHNEIHGGGQWTWTGDLATHLRESHGVQTGGKPVGAIFPISRQSAVISPRFTVRPTAQRVSFVGRSRVKVRKSCPASGCPRG